MFFGASSSRGLVYGVERIPTRLFKTNSLLCYFLTKDYIASISFRNTGITCSQAAGSFVFLYFCGPFQFIYTPLPTPPVDEIF